MRVVVVGGRRAGSRCPVELSGRVHDGEYTLIEVDGTLCGTLLCNA